MKYVLRVCRTYMILCTMPLCKCPCLHVYTLVCCVVELTLLQYLYIESKWQICGLHYWIFCGDFDGYTCNVLGKVFFFFFFHNRSTMLVKGSLPWQLHLVRNLSCQYVLTILLFVESCQKKKREPFIIFMSIYRNKW